MAGAEKEMARGLLATAKSAGRVLAPAAVAALCQRLRVEDEGVQCHVNALVAEDAVVREAAEDDDGLTFQIDVLLEQKADLQLAALRDYLESEADLKLKEKVLPEGLEGKELERFKSAALGYYIRPADRVLCRLWRSSRGKERHTVFHQVVLPQRLGQIVMRAYHDSPMGGHTGFAKLYEHLLRKYFWQGMYGEVMHYATTCKKCNTRKTPDRRLASEWAKRLPAWKPFQRVSVDFTPVGSVGIVAC